MFLEAARRAVERVGEFVANDVNLEAPIAQLLRDIAKSCARHYELHPESVEMMLQERAHFREQVFPTHLMYRTETRQGLEEMLREVMERGELRQVDVAQAYNAYADLLFGSLVSGCLEGATGSLLHRIEHAVDMFLHGLVQDSSSSNA